MILYIKVIILEVYVLASGSKGNITYLKSNNLKIVIDVGISFLRIRQKFAEHNESLDVIDGLFLTHEHQDHTYGLKMFLKNVKVKNVFLTKGTYNGLAKDVREMIKNPIYIKSDDSFIFNEINVLPFMTSHDANEPVGFKLSYNNKDIVILTDTGYLDRSYYNVLENADLYILEANHNPSKLMSSPRPYVLKQRILSERGHLSNEDASWLMNRLIKNGKSIWVVAHMSEDCNSVEDVEEAIINVFDDPTKVEVYYANQEGLPVIKI